MPKKTGKVKLRDYQEEALNRIKGGLEEGVKKQLIVLPTGCHAAGTRILMYDGTTKAVEDIEVGDQLMGPDSKPRSVKSLARGQQQMARITPTKGDSFVVNLDHMLSLYRTPSRKSPKYPSQAEGVTDVTVREWLNWSKTKKHRHKLQRVDVDFQSPEILRLEPYMLGVWLGDGTTLSPSITTADATVVEYIYGYASELGVRVRCEEVPDNKANTYHLVSDDTGWGSNPFRNLFYDLGLMKGETKFIPFKYKVASRQDRLELLAGLLDTDGHLSNNGYDYISVSQQLSEDLAFVARSLGLAAYVNECEKSCQNDFTGTYWRVSISGDLSVIPNKVERRKATPRKQAKKVTVTGFDVELLDEGDYYGFHLDSDHLYLTGDFTVHHNSGKTVCFSHVPQSVVPGRMLILAHRGELLKQAKETFEWVHGNDISVGREQANSYASLEDDVVVATVQTLGRTDSERIQRFPPDHFNTVVVDEAHHASNRNSSYLNVLDYFEPVLRLGVTATPQRSDNVGLYEVFDEIVYSRSILEMIEEGYLVDIVGYRVDTEVDISDVKTHSGDYSISDLAATINTSKRNALAIDAYERYGEGTKMLVFCADVAHAEAMARAFTEAGYKSAGVFGKTNPDERKRILHEFDTGELRVLTNYGVALEGYDQPDIGTVMMARPTKSNIVYQQAVGRGLRLAPGKDKCIVIDLADVTKGRSPVGLPTLMGLPSDMDLEGESVTEALGTFNELSSLSPGMAAQIKSVSDMEEAFEKVDLFMPSDPPEELFETSNLVWAQVSQDKYVLHIDQSERFEVELDALDRWVVTYKGDVEKELVKLTDLHEAVKRTDKWVKKERTDKTQLLDRTASWRSDPPTQNQLRFLRRKKLPIFDGMSKGQASQIIDKYIRENPRSQAQQRAIENAKRKKK